MLAFAILIQLHQREVFLISREPMNLATIQIALSTISEGPIILT